MAFGDLAQALPLTALAVDSFAIDSDGLPADVTETKRIGWHSFRHGLSLFLRLRGIDVKIGPGPAPARQQPDHPRYLSAER